jgi:hypothetical protein
LVLVDACHAAFEVDASHVDQATSGDFLYFAGCGPDQVTYETQGGGVFTQWFLAEFRDAVSNSRPIDIRELNQRIALRIRKAEFDQSPVLVSLSGDQNLVFETKGNANKEGCIAACQQIHPWLNKPGGLTKK